MNFIERKKFNDLFNILTKENGISNDKFQRYEEATSLLGFFNEQLKSDKDFLSSNQLKLLKKLYKNEYKYLKKFLYPKSDLSKPKIFHKNNCKEISNVPYENGIIFKDRNEAIERGYRPCYVCSP